MTHVFECFCRFRKNTSLDSLGLFFLRLISSYLDIWYFFNRGIIWSYHLCCINIAGMNLLRNPGHLGCEIPATGCNNFVTSSHHDYYKSRIWIPTLSLSHRENGGTLEMVPLIINPIYTLYSGYLLGPISPFKGLLGELKQLGYHPRATIIFPMIQRCQWHPLGAVLRKYLISIAARWRLWRHKWGPWISINDEEVEGLSTGDSILTFFVITYISREACYILFLFPGHVFELHICHA